MIEYVLKDISHEFERICVRKRVSYKEYQGIPMANQWDPFILELSVLTIKKHGKEVIREGNLSSG